MPKKSLTIESFGPDEMALHINAKIRVAHFGLNVSAIAKAAKVNRVTAYWYFQAPLRLPATWTKADRKRVLKAVDKHWRQRLSSYQRLLAIFDRLTPSGGGPA